MSRTSFFYFELVASGLLLLMPDAAAAQEHSFTLDMLLKIEGIGSAQADSSGHLFFYERVRPYDEFDDYSFRTYAMRKTGHQIWRYDLETGGKPELLPGVDQRAHSFLQGASPSGRYLAIMQYSFGELSLLVYDVNGETTVRFDHMPAFSKAGEYNPLWLSDDELVFAASPEGEMPALTSVRAYAGSMLPQAWQDAWRGKTVTAQEVRTIPLDESGEQEPGYLIRANAGSGATSVLAEGLYADLRLAPGGRFLAAMSVSKPLPVKPDELVEEDSRGYGLTLFDLMTNGARLLAPKLDFFPYTITWAPDGQRLAAFGWPADKSPRDGRFYVVEIRTGTVTRYDHDGLDLVSERERGWLQRPERTMFLNGDLVVFARPIPEGEEQLPRFTYQDIQPRGLARSDWYVLSVDGTSRNLTGDIPGVSGIPVSAGDGQVTIWGEDGVYRVYASGERIRLMPQLSGRLEFLPPGTFATHSTVIRPEFGAEAVFTVKGDGQSNAKMVMVDMRVGHEGESAIVEAPSADAEPLAGSLAKGSVLFRAEDGLVSSRLLVAAESSRLQVIDTFNRRLDEVEFGEWRTISYEVKDPSGKLAPQVLESCVLLPPDRDDRPLPLIVEVYPDVGPSCNNGAPKITFANPVSEYLWAGRGYAYTRLTMPRELIRTAQGPIAGMDELVDSGVEALAREGLIDPDRVALFGLSQGGISALYTAAHSDRFKAVIAINSWADLFSQYFGPNGIYSYAYGQDFGDFARYDSIVGSDFGIGRTPFDDPEVYYRNSPVFLAPQIEAPVMLIHSDMDSFSMSQFDEMYGALTRAGKDARYVRYWGEGHVPSSPANIRDMWQRIDDFLGEHGVAP